MARLRAEEPVAWRTPLPEAEGIVPIEAAAEPDPLRSSFIHGVERLPARFTPTGRR